MAFFAFLYQYSEMSVLFVKPSVLCLSGPSSRIHVFKGVKTAFFFKIERIETGQLEINSGRGGIIQKCGQRIN